MRHSSCTPPMMMEKTYFSLYNDEIRFAHRKNGIDGVLTYGKVDPKAHASANTREPAVLEAVIKYYELQVIGNVGGAVAGNQTNDIIVKASTMSLAGASGKEEAGASTRAASGHARASVAGRTLGRFAKGKVDLAIDEDFILVPSPQDANWGELEPPRGPKASENDVDLTCTEFVYVQDKSSVRFDSGRGDRLQNVLPGIGTWTDTHEAAALAAFAVDVGDIGFEWVEHPVLETA